MTQKTTAIEGFDAYLHESNVRSPRGEYMDVVTGYSSAELLPCRSDDVIRRMANGERRTAVNICVGPQQPHEQFLPPPGAVITERPGFGGFMSFSAVALRLAFAGQPPIDAVTTEENAYALKAPSGIALTLATSVVDPAKHLVRIRVLANATGSPGNVRGDLLDEIHVPLGSTGETTRIGETLSVTVTRVGTLSR